MTEREAHVVHLHDRHGELYGVLLSPQVWAAVQHKVAPLLEQALEKMYPSARPEPMDDWRTFKDYWDFKYPFCADVHCDCCGATTEDWEHDPLHPFMLRNATLSGMLVFDCVKCGASVRKKHFKDHICFEFTPASPK